MYDKNYLRERIGSMRQLAGIRRAELEDGKGRGMRILDVNNGSGLSFTVYPDRGMDIGETFFKGIPIAWITPNGPVAPQFYDASGLNWLRSWGGGLLTGCGLMNVGGPNTSGGEEHGLHGRLSHTPAGQVNAKAAWDSDGVYRIELDGEIRVSRVFGKNIFMTRKISTALGENAIIIEDEVENQGFRPTPFMLFYHMNFGWPLVDESTVLTMPEHKVIPQNDIAIAGLGEWNRMCEPEGDWVEQVFYHQIPADENGMAKVVMSNPKLKLQVTVEYRVAELPYLVEWKQMGKGEYVCGLEPANCFPEGQAGIMKRGMLKKLQPGEVSTSFVKVSFQEL
ncbi:MAG: aldose 1-epimerase family protein [Lentisphaeria bacterium]|nr:aldose 1-epimerase family protein [Lentisphaeria bacterium]